MNRVTRIFSVVFTLGVLVGSLSVNGFAANPHCTSVGGAILTNLGGFGTIDGAPTTLGVATGDLKGGLGVQILSANSDFTSITVQHHWVTDNGDTLSIAQATVHGVYVGPELLAVTDYKVHLNGGTGHFANAIGDMSAIGEIDFNTGHAVLRYSGQVCDNKSN
jgi:hypothetical protein